jgi:YihY family inner membrane protein
VNTIPKNLKRLNHYQQRHGLIGFIVAVSKKYGEDQGGRQTSLLAYYAFWSLFPLLIVFTTITQLLIANHTALHHEVTVSVNNYFPILGQRLQQNVHLGGKSGLALVVSAVLTIYGARGVAEAFRYTVNHFWRVSPRRLLGFPKNLLNDLILIVSGGLGLIGTSVIAGFVTGGSHLLVFRLLYGLITFSLLFIIFIYLTKISLVDTISIKDLFSGAAVCAIGFTLFQLAGGFVVTHELKNLDSLYGSFAIALGLLFWLSLQAQVIVYALEINTVYIKRLWPRSLETAQPTEADKRALESLAKIYT